MKSLPLKTLHIYVGISLLVFAVVEVLKQAQLPAPAWVFNYVNDLLVIPIVGLACLHVIWLFKKNRKIRLDWISIFLLVLIFSFYFEIYLPPISKRYTADYWDVLCYSLGGFTLYFLQKFP